MKTTRYKRKPTYCTAMQFVKENLADEQGPIVATQDYILSYLTDGSGKLSGIFVNAFGPCSIYEGDYIVKGEDGIPRVVKPEDFEREYEAAE